MSSFGEYLKKLRSEAGLSQQKLAEKMEVSKNTIQNWESGKNNVDYGRFSKLAEIFNVPVMSLYAEYDRKKSSSRSDNWPDFLFNDAINKVIDSLHLNINQQDLFGLLYIYEAEYLKKDVIDFNTFYKDFQLIPYGFIEKVGSIQFMNLADGLQRVIKYVKSDFLLKILKQNPEIEFDIRKLTKDQICEFIDSGHKEADMDINVFDDIEHVEEADNSFRFHISMAKAKVILPLLEKGPIHITDGNRCERVRKDIPREIVELYISADYEYWRELYDNPEELGRIPYGDIRGHIIRNELWGVADYYNAAQEGEEEKWFLEINEKGRSLLNWFNEKE